MLLLHGLMVCSDVLISVPQSFRSKVNLSISPQVYELQMRAGTFLQRPHKVRCRKETSGAVKHMKSSASDMYQERGLASWWVSQLVRYCTWLVGKQVSLLLSLLV